MWSRWAWSRERFPRSRSPPPPSTTPTGRPSARVSTTRRTAGRPRTTPSGSGYRSVTSLEVGGRTEVMSHWFLFCKSDLRSVGRRKARSPRFEPCRTSRDLARIWSEYCSLICTTFTLKKKQEITQHALFIETCLSSAVDIFFCLHCEI